MSERERAEQFVGRVQAELGDGVAAALLYGSAARGEYRAGTSDLNLLVILKQLGVGELRRVSGVTRSWIEDGNPPPLLMTEEEWQGSADVFPLEYSDIRDAHVLLAGADPFAGISIDAEHLRLQLEHEVRSKKIQLREGYIATGASEEKLGTLLVRSLSSFLAIFRAMLRLDGQPVPGQTPALIRAVAGRAGFDPAPVLEVHSAKEAGRLPGAALDGGLAAGYLGAVESTARWLDEFRIGRTGAPGD